MRIRRILELVMKGERCENCERSNILCTDGISARTLTRERSWKRSVLHALYRDFARGPIIARGGEV